MTGFMPWIVCLLGSTRFREAYEAENRRLTLEGKIVLTCGVWVHHEAEKENSPEVKKVLDELHLRKIDLADEVRVINVGKYVGESTKREIEYALNACKLVTWLEGPFGTQAVCAGCSHVGYAAVGQPRAHLEFARDGWKMIPRRRNDTGGYALCPACADTPEQEIDAARMLR